MITVVNKGGRTRGLVEYLFGPGRHEEHTNQRIVGAWQEGWVGITRPDEVQRALLTAELDRPLLAAELAGETPPQAHVYHVSISNHGEDRTLTDAEWNTVAEAVADKLGFTATEQRAGVRWIAVHHGEASGGRDHIHLQATLVREDGTPVYLGRDFVALREVAQDMQQRFGLAVRVREAGAGQPSLSRQEVQTLRATAAAQRDEHPGVEPPVTVAALQESVGRAPRRRIEQAVRAAAAASRTESEFVTQLGHRKLAVAPHWQKGGTGVDGYRVSLAAGHPEHPGGQVPWFSGGKLAPDLSLPALRQGWEPEEDTAGVWRTAAAGPTATASQKQATRQPGAARQPGAVRQPEVAAEQAGDRWDTVRTTLDTVVFHSTMVGPPSATTAWTRTGRDVANTYAALAETAPPQHRHAVAEAATQMSRAGQTPHGAPRGKHSRLQPRLCTVASTVLAASASNRHGMDVILAQMVTLSRTIAEVHATEGRVLAAQAATRAGDVLQTSLDTYTPPTPRKQSLYPNAAEIEAMYGPSANIPRSRGIDQQQQPPARRPGLGPERDTGSGR